MSSLRLTSTENIFLTSCFHEDTCKRCPGKELSSSLNRVTFGHVALQYLSWSSSIGTRCLSWRDRERFAASGAITAANLWRCILTTLPHLDSKIFFHSSSWDFPSYQQKEILLVLQLILTQNIELHDAAITMIQPGDVLIRFGFSHMFFFLFKKRIIYIFLTIFF